VLPLLLSKSLPETRTIPSTARVMATSAPNAELRPPRADFPTVVFGNPAIGASAQEAAPVPKMAVVSYQTPGAAFLDSMLLQFHTMVARALAGNGEVSRF
jgi:hypothetical protein